MENWFKTLVINSFKKILKMKKVLIALVVFVFAFNLNSSAQTKEDKRIRVVAVFAHPDDADSKMGGTAALLAKMGVAVKFVAYCLNSSFIISS